MWYLNFSWSKMFCKTVHNTCIVHIHIHFDYAPLIAQFWPQILWKKLNFIAITCSCLIGPAWLCFSTIFAVRVICTNIRFECNRLLPHPSSSRIRIIFASQCQKVTSRGRFKIFPVNSVKIECWILTQVSQIGYVIKYAFKCNPINDKKYLEGGKNGVRLNFN